MHTNVTRAGRCVAAGLLLCASVFGISLSASAGTGGGGGSTTVGLSFQKFVNGADADLTPVDIVVGTPLTFTYSVSMVSNDPLFTMTVALTDDAGTPGIPGDDFNPAFDGGDNGNNVLNVGETWFFTSAGVFDTLAVLGEHVNIATAAFAAGGSITPLTDPARYRGVAVPEPGTVLLLASGLAGLGYCRARLHRRRSPP